MKNKLKNKLKLKNLLFFLNNDSSFSIVIFVNIGPFYE